MKNRPFHQRVGFAIEGLKSGWLRERSFRTHCLFALAALMALIVLRPAPVWWALVAITTSIVMALELVNSAIEGVIDLLYPGLHPEIKIIKDMVAGAVLIVSLTALIVAAALLVAAP